LPEGCAGGYRPAGERGAAVGRRAFIARTARRGRVGTILARGEAAAHTLSTDAGRASSRAGLLIFPDGVRATCLGGILTTASASGGALTGARTCAAQIEAGSAVFPEAGCGAILRNKILAALLARCAALDTLAIGACVWAGGDGFPKPAGTASLNGGVLALISPWCAVPNAGAIAASIGTGLGRLPDPGCVAGLDVLTLARAGSRIARGSIKGRLYCQIRHAGVFRSRVARVDHTGVYRLASLASVSGSGHTASARRTRDFRTYGVAGCAGAGTGTALAMAIVVARDWLVAGIGAQVGGLAGKIDIAH